MNAANEAAAPSEATRDPRAYHVRLPTFEGPLDLLLHLIQTHQLDILDIPMRFVTERYLEYLSLMRSLTIDVASEYLVMAAVLTHIKSKMLLPEVPANQEDELGGPEEDPREELVRRLLEYQKYKSAAAELQARGVPGQNAFPRIVPAEETESAPGPLAAVPLVDLLGAFRRVLERKQLKIDHEVTFDRLSITERINQLTDALRARKRMEFEALFEGVASRFDLVITFLALLEMTKLRMTRLFQSDPLSPLYVEFALADDEGANA